MRQALSYGRLHRVPGRINLYQAVPHPGDWTLPGTRSFDSASEKATLTYMQGFSSIDVPVQGEVSIPDEKQQVAANVVFPEMENGGAAMRIPLLFGIDHGGNAPIELDEEHGELKRVIPHAAEVIEAKRITANILLSGTYEGMEVRLTSSVTFEATWTRQGGRQTMSAALEFPLPAFLPDQSWRYGVEFSLEDRRGNKLRLEQQGPIAVEN